MNSFKTVTFRLSVDWSVVRSLWGKGGASAIVLWAGLGLAETAVPKPPLALHKMNQKFCDWQLDLDVGRDQFVEAANKLPGLGDYNSIIRAYRKKDYSAVQQQIALFRQIHEGSPFIEALDFLEAQMGFDQAKSYDDPTALDAERRVRQAALLYPKSSFLAPVSANMASFWLKTGRFQRSLALYQKLTRSHKEGPYSCVFQTGVAESHFQLNQWKEAQAQFEQMLLTCRNRRLMVGGLLRLGDMQRADNLARAEQYYERARKDGIPLIDRHYREALFNMGEVAYRRGRYPSASHFFTQFLKMIGEQSSCIPRALKRTADSAAALGAKTEKIVGLYLGVKDKVPETDEGIASYLHALLLNLTEKNAIERERRLRIIQEELPKIKDRDWYARIEAEVLLVDLALGNLDTLDELDRISGKPNSFLGGEEYIKFIQNQSGKLLSEGGLKLRKSEVREPLKYLKRIEEIFTRWAAKGKYSIRVGDKYAEILLQEVRHSLASGETSRALAFLDYWKRSPLWKVRGIRPPEQAGLAEAALRSLFSSDGKAVFDVDRIASIRTVRKELSEFTGPFQKYVDLTVAVRSAEPKALEKTLKKPPASTELVRLPKEMQAFVKLDLGRAFAAQGKHVEAADLFRSALSGPYRGEAERSLIQQWEASGAFTSLIRLAKERMDAGEDRDRFLQSALKWAESAKAWNEAEYFANYRDIENPELRNGVLRFIGRAAFETDKCNESVQAYSTVSGEPDAADKYRMGKCLAKLNKDDEARKIFRDVARSKDKAWRELARSQINQLSK